MSRLAGRVALVTGAGGGIGSAVCERFLAEGAVVAALDVDVDRARLAVAGASPGQALPLACDVSRGEEVRAAISHVGAEHGRIDVLVNIAGGSTAEDGPVTEAAEEEFWRVMGLDLFGTFLVCRHGIPALIAAGGGAVVNLTSVLAVVGVPGRDCYTAAKGGVASMTRSMAAEYGADGVRVNAIAPGVVLTPRVEALYRRDPSARAFEDRELVGTCTPDDIAQLAVFLASGESARITGQVLQVDSGVTIH